MVGKRNVKSIVLLQHIDLSARRPFQLMESLNCEFSLNLCQRY